MTVTDPTAPIVAATTDPAPFPLRDYQTAAIESVEAAFATGKRRVAIVLPTGAGKTVVFSHLIARQPLGSRVLVLAHRTELVDQAADKIREIAPHLSVGIVRNVEKNHEADVVVASVPTICRPDTLNTIDPCRFDLVVVDEAHHATARTYRDVLSYFGSARAVGVSATLVRGDDAALGDIWEQVVYRLDILDLIDREFLCDVRGIRVTAEGLDLDNVKTGSDGDYRVGQLEEEMTAAGAWEATVEAYARHARDRVGIVFTPTVASAHEVARLLVGRGIVAEAVDGETHRDEREAILDRFATGQTQVVANCGVLTEGYDNPAISCVAIARPTKSKGLYVQMGGRGLRLHPGKRDCLILDLVGVTDGKELASLADLTGHDVDEVRDGESLREAKERGDSTLRSTTSTPYLGELTEHEVNLFATSKVAWSVWNGDVRYIDVPHKYGPITIYLAPGPVLGLFDAIARQRRTGREKVIAEDVSLGAAMRKAEAQAAEWGGVLVDSGGWRHHPASPKQLAVLRRRGIPTPAGTTRGQASALLTGADIERNFAVKAPRGYGQAAA